VSVQVLVCVLSNGLNHEDWPRVVSDDIHRHLERLRSKVVTLRGHAEGRTLLPLPLCVERARPQDIVQRLVCNREVLQCTFVEVLYAFFYFELKTILGRNVIFTELN